MSGPTLLDGGDRDGRNDAWRERAACLDEPTSTFYPVVYSHGRHDRRDELKAKENEAKAICARCPVTQECLEDALADPLYVDQGIRGCTNEDERRAIRRQRGQQVAQTQRERRAS